MSRRQVQSCSGMISTALVSVVLWGCGLENPGLPSWTVDALVPFSQRTYRASELITPDDKFAERRWGLREGGSDLTLIFIYTDSLERETIGDRIQYKASRPRRFTNAMREVVLDDYPPDTLDFPVDNFLPDSIHAGYRGEIPSQNFANLTGDLNLDGLDWAQLRNGYLITRLDNRLPVAVEAVEVRFYNRRSGDFIGTARWGEIPAGGWAVDSLELRGVLLQGALRAVLSGSTAPSAGRVSVRGDEFLRMQIWNSLGIALSARAELGARKFSQPDTLDTPNRNHLIEGVIRNGLIVMSIANPLPTQVHSQTTFLNIQDSTGAPLVAQVDLDPGSTGSPTFALDTVDLAECRITMTDEDQSIHIFNTIVTEDTRVTRFNGSTYQTFEAGEGAQFTYYSTDIIFHDFTGLIDSSVVTFKPQETDLDIIEGLDSLDFVGDTLFITLINEAIIDVIADLELKSLNTRQLPMRELVRTVREVLHPGENRLRIPNVDRLFSISPNLMRLSGQCLTGAVFIPEMRGSVVHVSDREGFYGEATMKAETKFVMGNMHLESDPTLLAEKIDLPVEEIMLNLSLTNRLPFGGKVYLLAGSDTTALDTLVATEIPANPAVNHRPIPLDTSFSVTIAKDLIDIFTRDTVWVQQVLDLKGSAGDTLYLIGDDHLVVNSIAHVKYTVKF